jgi:hypothetical protein
MGCFELSALFPKVRDSDKKLSGEENNPSSSGECSTKGRTGTNSGVISESYAHNLSTNSGTNSRSCVTSDPRVNVEGVVDPVVATDGVIDSPGPKLSQSG